MADRIQLKRSDVPGRVPVSADLAVGELAVNTADGKLFVKLADGSVAQVGGGGSVAVVRRSQLFTANGTWLRSANQVGDVVHVTEIGGGASGNSSSDPAGGNSGAAVQRVPVDIGSATSVAVTVGAGAAGVNGGDLNTAGLAGSPSSFGSFLSVDGGTANNANGSVSDAGSGLSGSYKPATFSIFSIPSHQGPFGAPSRPPQDFRSRSCGASGLLLDGSGVTGVTTRVGHQGGLGYGAGGAASGSNSTTSGAGAPGAVLVEWDEVIEL